MNAPPHPATPDPASGLDLFGFLLKHTPDQIYFKDRDGRFLRVSHVVAKGFGFSNPDDAIGLSDFDFFIPEFAREAHADEQRIIETGEPLIGKVERLARLDGSITWNHTTKLPLRDGDGKIIGICGINKDISALHEMQEQLTTERNRLQELTAELQARNAQLDADLQMAREVQEALLPRDYPLFTSRDSAGNDGFFFAHCYRPAAAVGGDFFDIFPLSPSRAGVFICDVMGHGLRAALITAIIRGLLEELRPMMNNPGEFMEALNQRLRTILQRVEEPLVATAFYLIADRETNQVHFANAAHPSPVYLGRDRGIAEPLAMDTRTSGPALGLFDKAVFTTSSHPFEARDGIVLFTDGLYEVDSPEGAVYGQASLISTMARYAGLPAEELFEAVLADVSAFSSNRDFEDDVCILAIDRVIKRSC